MGASEIAKLEEEIARLRGLIKSKDSKLNSDFVQKAPPADVEKERQLLEALQEQHQSAMEALRQLLLQPPIGMTQVHFLEWRSPRRGTDNPHDMTNDVWKWLIKTQLPDDYMHTRLTAYQANDAFNGPSSYGGEPGWCFARYGQSETTLPDGRIVYISGEHEDYYDPDFYIYNDVVIVDPSGGVQIFGYPTEVFPPTDFHSTTLVDTDIILIGNLGYSGERHYGQTQVLRLEIDTWRISPIETFGDLPGWIHNHKAELSPDGNEIRIIGGKVDRGTKTSFIENIDEWSLDLQTWHWKRLTRHQWARFSLRRKDEKRNHLSEMQSLLLWKQLAERDKQYEKTYKESEAELKKKLGRGGLLSGFFKSTLPDLQLLKTLYAPDVATEIITKNVLDDEDEEYNVYRVRVGDVIVRYIESSYDIQITVEGELSPDIVEQLRDDVMQKFAALEGVPIVCQTIQSE